MTKFRILVVDDEEAIRESCSEALSMLPGVEVEAEGSSSKAAVRVKSETFHLVLSDVRMPGLDGFKLLSLVKRHDPDLAVLIMTGFPSIHSAVEAMKLGAADYVMKPFTAEEIQARVLRIRERASLRDENRFLARRLGGWDPMESFDGQSRWMRETGRLIAKLARVDADVLITGESGTGKELAARALHARSRRAEGRFVPVNCAAIPDALMESEFFGYEKGAFTGAERGGLGLLEYAEGGTLFLDEICELAPALQGKLLRVLQERSYRRVGGREELKVDVRIIAATNREVEEEVRHKRFRQDLYYRINALRLAMAPLRERREDIPLLTMDIILRLADEHGLRSKAVNPEAMKVLKAYAWPGNIRELQNVLRNALLLGSSAKILLEDLPQNMHAFARGGEEASGKGLDFKRFLRDQEGRYLRALMDRVKGDPNEALAISGLSKSSFYRLLREHGLNPGEYSRA